MFVEVPCLICGSPVIQPRRGRGRHARTCSAACWQEQHRRTNRKHKAKLKAGGGSKVATDPTARPVPLSFADFISAQANFEASDAVSVNGDLLKTLETQGIATDGAAERDEFLPISFDFRAMEPMTMKPTEHSPDELHELQVRAVSRSVSRLVSHTGYAPEAIIEGALRGASAIGIGMGSSADEMAALVENFAFGLRNLDKPDLKVVQ
ncbi:hypothetical protein GTW25_00165 [Aliihoeflea aestuarii]|uniref:hypothetical protein n=1 Tax=Aliihoeflea aestuarii TaxID=453840 RepID=UPI002093DDF5|nr:hypothetical protein [Aliihoeflea aestuarii]MCO6389444.1 hypothetical protein [Aliihoeflea aestuarii]